MGQKVNPVGFRLGVNRGWDSVWYAKKKDFGNNLIEDFKIRDYIKKKGVKMKKYDIEKQEDFIKNHPTWRDHDFGFEKNHLDANDISRAINIKKLQLKSDNIVKIKIY